MVANSVDAHHRAGRRADRGRTRDHAAAGARAADARLPGERGRCSCWPPVGFVVSVALALRIPRRRSGPDDAGPGPRPATSSAGLVEALSHLRRPSRRRSRAARPSALHRIVYGIVTVATILVYRNYFHALTDVEPGHRRPRAAGRRHRRRLRGRGGGHPPLTCPVRASDGWIDRLPVRPRRSSSCCPGRSTPRSRCWSPRSCSASRRRASRSASTPSSRPTSTTSSRAGSSCSTT